MHSFAWWPTLAVVAVATATDLKCRRIPNWLVLPFLGAGVGVSAWLHGRHGFDQSLEGLTLGLLIYGFLFWMGGMGAGDVKLCAGIGAWIGPRQLFLALVLTALAGGLMALAWAVRGGFFTELLQDTGELVLGKGQRGARPATEGGSASEPLPPALPGRKMPYAPAIAVGTLLSFLAH